jgi:hypothetical protein
MTVEVSNAHFTETPSGNGTTVMFDESSVTASIERTGCANSTDNQAMITATGPAPPGTFTAFNGTWSTSADGRSLTISSTSGQTLGFTRE